MLFLLDDNSFSGKTSFVWSTWNQGRTMSVNLANMRHCAVRFLYLLDWQYWKHTTQSSAEMQWHLQWYRRWKFLVQGAGTFAEDLLSKWGSFFLQAQNTGEAKGKVNHTEQCCLVWVAHARTHAHTDTLQHDGSTHIEQCRRNVLCARFVYWTGGNENGSAAASSCLTTAAAAAAAADNESIESILLARQK